MSDSTYRIAIIGAGIVGRKHAAAYASLPNMKLQIVCDSNKNFAIQLTNRFRFERIETDWHKAVNASDVDIVCICVPNHLHFAIASEAIRAGKHIMCEKPLGMNCKESEELARLAADNKILASCCYNLIHIPAIQYVKRMITSGELGDLVCFRGSYDNDRLSDPNAMFEWRMCKKNAQGGSLCDLALNILSISQFLFGDILSVSGVTDIVYLKRKDFNGYIKNVENDDVSQFIYTYKNGGMGYISSNRVAVGSKQDMKFEAQLTKGTIRFSLERMNEIHIFKLGERGFTNVIADDKGWFNVGYEELKTLDAKSFLINLYKNSQPKTDFIFASKIDKTIESVIESAKKKQWVTIR